MPKSEYHNAAQETMPVADRERYLTDRLRAIIPYAYKHAPAVKEKMDRAGVTPAGIQNVADLEKIPITRKDDFTEQQKKNPPLGGFLAVPRFRTAFVSPGPIYEPEDTKEQIDICAAALYAGGFRRGDTAIITFSFHLVPAGIRMSMVCHKMGVAWIPTGVGNTELQLEIMRDLKVNAYVGTPSFLGLIIKKAEELGHDFRRDYHLEKSWHIAEMLPPSLRQIFESHGISATQGYGTAELGTLAYECREKSGMHIPDEVIVEIVDPKTGKQLPPGEVGEVVATPFNKIYPLIRYGTGDLSSVTTEPCPCGRTSYRLTGVLGRAGEEVKVRGMFLHPRQVQAVMNKFDQVARFQVVVKREGQRDDLTVNIELKGEASDRQQLAADLTRNFQELCRVKPDRIECLAGGTIPEKHKLIADERVWK